MPEGPAYIAGMPVLKVTFDTSALKGAVTPDLCADEPDHAACVVVHEALRAGQIRGYFGEAVVALDALVGRTRSMWSAALAWKARLTPQAAPRSRFP